jgi:Xaa-Pro aminopeptidase
MFQNFTTSTRPEQGPARLDLLRAELTSEGLDGFLVPRADAHQGEYVAPCDERLSWLTGFTGSAGFCVALRDVAGVFIDGRYRTQVKAQVADVYTPVPWPDVTLVQWLIDQLPNGGQVGFDPWLHTVDQISHAAKSLSDNGITLERCANLVDRVWADRPAAPCNPLKVHPTEFAGESAAAKASRLGQDLAHSGHRAAVITLPDSIMWLLNIRGSDIARNPIAQGFATLNADGSVDLFMDTAKLDSVRDHLADSVRIHTNDGLLAHLETLDGPVRIDPTTCPQIVADVLADNAVFGAEPCALPKARKNSAEIAGARAAHLRDGAAVVELLTWLDAQPIGSLSETQVVCKLEQQRRHDNALQDISFETIAGTGPHGAIMHYRVTHDTDATLQSGDLLVLDSGGQYLDGTTDITRTIAIGPAGTEERAAFTRVLQGMIAMSRLRWPVGLAGRDIECVGRMPLWLAGQDFNHGLGHGVGAYLSVHEGPQRLSRVSHVPIEAGMILSNEPGYYREGAFGIRIENLVVAHHAQAMDTADPEREMLEWETLTFAPIDRNLIVLEMLTAAERNWINAYHSEVSAKIGPRVGVAAAAWLDSACAPL